MATQNDINMRIVVDANQAEQSTTNYKKTLKDLQAQMIDLQVSTNGLANATDEQRAQYAALEQQAGKLSDAISDVSTRVRANADDYQTFNAALEGLKGGAAVAQGLVGTLDLLGISNTGVEQVVKTLMSLQGVMNSINVVQQIFNKDSKIRIALTKLMTTSTVVQTGATTTATAAQKALNLAMNAMPIMAIVSAAALLITALTKIAKKNKETADTTDEVTKSQQEFYKTIQQTAQKYTDLEATGKEYLEIINSSTASDERKTSALKELNSLMGTTGVTLNNANKAFEEYTNGVISASKNLDTLINRQKNEKEQGIDDINTTKAIAGAKTILGEAQEQLANKYKKVEQASKDTKKAVEEETEVWRTKVELQDKYITETLPELIKGEKEYKDISQTLDESNTIIANYLTGQLQDYEQYSDKWIEASKLLLHTQREIEIDSYKQQYEDGKISWELYQSEKYRIEQKYAQKEKDLQTDITNRQKEEDSKRIAATQTRLEMVGQMLQYASDFSQTLMDAELAAAEGNEQKQKEIKKKYATANAIMQIGKIGIDTALAIMGVWSAYGEIPFAGPVIAGALSAAIGALGIANTAKAIAEKNKIMKAAKGAFVVGNSHSQGGVMMELEGGEAVINKRAMAIPQYRNLASAMNVATGGVAFPGTTNSVITSTIDERAVDMIVSKIAAIPVVVSEQSITNVQRKVGVIEGRSRF